MPTSELSDALNPNVVRQRNYDDVLVYQDQQVHSDTHPLTFHYEESLPQPLYEYAPHRSELEHAVVETIQPQRYYRSSLIHLHCSDSSQATAPGQSHTGRADPGRHEGVCTSGKGPETHMGEGTASYTSPVPGSERGEVSRYARGDRFAQRVYSTH